MARTTVTLPEVLLEQLRAIAAEEHASLGAVIREALAERAARHWRSAKPQPPLKAVGADAGEAWPKPASLGIDESEYADTSVRAGAGISDHDDAGTPEPHEKKPWPEMTSIGTGHSGKTDIGRRAGDEPPEPDPWR